MRNSAFSLGRICAWLALLAFVLILFGLLSEFMREQQEIHHRTRPDPGTFSVWQWGSLAIVGSTVASVIATLGTASTIWEGDQSDGNPKQIDDKPKSSSSRSSSWSYSSRALEKPSGFQASKTSDLSCRQPSLGVGNAPHGRVLGVFHLDPVARCAAPVAAIAAFRHHAL